MNIPLTCPDAWKMLNGQTYKNFLSQEKREIRRKSVKDVSQFKNLKRMYYIRMLYKELVVSRSAGEAYEDKAGHKQIIKVIFKKLEGFTGEKEQVKHNFKEIQEEVNDTNLDIKQYNQCIQQVTLHQKFNDIFKAMTNFLGNEDNFRSDQNDFKKTSEKGRDNLKKQLL